VKPLLVFDGQSLEEKVATQLSRRERRAAAVDRVLEHDGGDLSASTRTAMKQAAIGGLTPTLVGQCIGALRKLSVP
jgi:hypothetical protein